MHTLLIFPFAARGGLGHLEPELGLAQGCEHHFQGLQELDDGNIKWGNDSTQEQL